MAARKAGKKIFDWVAIGAKFPAEAKSEFHAFRNRHEVVKSALNAYPAKAEAIDWDQYKSRITKPGFADSFKKHYEALNIPYPKDVKSSAINTRHKEMEKECELAIKEARDHAEQLGVELTKIKSEKPYEEMTVDEFLEDKPELRKQIEEDTRNHNWYF